jgi:hypothetical protein
MKEAANRHRREAYQVAKDRMKAAGTFTGASPAA